MDSNYLIYLYVIQLFRIVSSFPKNLKFICFKIVILLSLTLNYLEIFWEIKASIGKKGKTLIPIVSLFYPASYLFFQYCQKTY